MTRVAAVDCGTNSIRLLIADVSAGDATGPATPRLTDIVREMRVVRLGQGVDSTGELAQEALERTFAATRDYAALIREHGAEKCASWPRPPPAMPATARFSSTASATSSASNPR